MNNFYVKFECDQTKTSPYRAHKAKGHVRTDDGRTHSSNLTRAAAVLHTS